MSALLVKDAPSGLHQWLKAEALFNRRSLNQQVLVCLEWCMRTYGAAQQRNPFATPSRTTRHVSTTQHDYAHGLELARRLASIEPIDAKTATEMRKAARSLRKAKVRDFDYACFA